jgi:arylsulfatase A-like enzyme
MRDKESSRSPMQRQSAIRNPQSAISKWTFFLLGVWFGLLAGFVEVVYTLRVKLVGDHWFVGLGRDFIWIIPLITLVGFTLPGLAFALLARFRPGWATRELALVVLASFFVFHLLLVWNRLVLWAALLLAVGAGRQIGLALAARWDGLFRVVQASLVWVLLAEVSLGILAIVPPLWSEQRGLADLPAPPRGQPNVLFITLDTVRAQSMSLHGYGRVTTPELERWAERGVWFQHAISPAPWTLPAHAALFTGYYPHELSAGWGTPLGPDCPTLAEALREQGYRTAGFVANHYYTTHETGLARGFLHYEDHQWRSDDCVNYCCLTRHLFGSDVARRHLDFYDLFGRKRAEDLNRDFLAWLGRQGKDRPFFAFLNYFDAHAPYLPPAPFDTRFGPSLTEVEKRVMSKWCYLVKEGLDRQFEKAAERAYDASLAYLDHHVGRLLAELDRRGILDDTLVVITADHGEHFGEHGLFGHGNSLYHQLVHVPLILIFPSRIAGSGCVAQPVSLRDLPATVMDLVGLEKESPFPGTSLVPCWASATTEPPPTSPVLGIAWPIPEPCIRPNHGQSPVASGAHASLALEGNYYIRNLRDGSEELYDLAADPEDTHNLADMPEAREALARCRAELLRLLLRRPPDR